MKVVFVLSAVIGAAFVLSVMSLFDLVQRGPEFD